MSHDLLAGIFGIPAADELSPVFVHQRAGRLDRLGQAELLDAGLPPVPDATAWRYLSALVARDALDLEAHARRVMLCCQSSEAGVREHCFGALLDLFLALGPQGRGLRSRLLDLARPHLAEDEALLLRQHLESGLAATAQLPAQPGSVLDRGVLGRLDLVRHERIAARELSAFEDAMARVDEGDLDGARQQLEALVLDEPGHADASRELQNLYRYLRDEAAPAALRERLQARHGSVPPAWQ